MQYDSDAELLSATQLIEQSQMSADFGDISDSELLPGTQLIEEFSASDVSDMDLVAVADNSANSGTAGLCQPFNPLLTNGELADLNNSRFCKKTVDQST